MKKYIFLRKNPSSYCMRRKFMYLLSHMLSFYSFDARLLHFLCMNITLHIYYVLSLINVVAIRFLSLLSCSLATFTFHPTKKSISAMINSRGVLWNFKWKSRLTSMLRNLLFNINKLYFFTLKLVMNLHKILIVMLLSLSKLILMRGISTIKAKWRVSEKITKIS